MTIHTATHPDARPAARWATYPNDARSAVGQVVGPTTLQDVLTLVVVEFDDETNTSRCGFAYGVAAGAQLPPWLQPLHPGSGLPTAATVWAQP